MINWISRLAVAGVVLLAVGETASASIVASLVFRDPTGTVAGNVPIPVYVTLTLDVTSDAITTDASGNVSWLSMDADIDSNLLPGVAAIPEDHTFATRSNTNVAFGCSGTFTTVCTDGPPYDFSFAFEFVGAANLTLLPGSSTDFLFGTFTPTGGLAPAGTYVFHYAAFFIQVWDDNHDDSLRDPLSSGPLHLADVPIANTTSDFTRDVTGAPEPGTYVLLLSGFALVGIVKHRRSQAVR